MGLFSHFELMKRLPLEVLRQGSGHFSAMPHSGFVFAFLRLPIAAFEILPCVQDDNEKRRQRPDSGGRRAILPVGGSGERALVASLAWDDNERRKKTALFLR